MTKGHRPAGGIKSNKNVSPAVKYGQPAKEKIVRGVAQIGGSYGNHAAARDKKLKGAVEPVRGGMIPGVGTVPLGNEVAKNVGRGGAGTGRKLYGQSGSQQQYGAPEGKPAPKGGRDALDGE